MKKSIKSVLAKSLAVVMAFSLAGIAPSTSSDAAAKKPSLTKKVSVKVGKTKTVKVTSKKKVKKTTWSLKKAGKKIVSLSKKKAKSVKVKGKKAGKATLTAKIKVGKKTYKKTCKITVTKASKPSVTNKPTNKPTPAPTNNNSNNGGGTVTPAPTPTTPSSSKPGPAVSPASSLTVNGKTQTVDEASTYRVDLTELNETTFTCDAKRPDENAVHSDILYNRDGSVTFASNSDYNSGVSYYVNPCTSEDQIEDISDTRGDGYLGYNNGTKDMFAYDYIRVVLSSENEMNFRTYNGNDQLLTAGFPGSATSETYEGGWVGPADASVYMEAGNKSAGQTVKEDYVTRTVFIPIASLMEKGMNPSTLTAVAICPQAAGEEVTIYDIAFVKVNYDTKVTGIEVTSNKEEVANGRTASLTAKVTPDDATRKIVRWESSNPELATVNYAGTVVAAAEGTGEVTFTATSTDGSDVSASITLKIGESSAPAKITTHVMDLTSDALKAQTNGGNAATASAAGLQFDAGGNMLYVNFADYLTANSLDLANYDSLKVTYQLKDADGSDAEESIAEYGKVALAAVADLNGYSDGVKAVYLQDYVSGTKEVSISDVAAENLATVAGFNFQASAINEDQYYVISDITLYKENSVTMDLSDSGIVAKNNGGSDGEAVTQSAAGLQFGKGTSMMYVNFADYLSANSLDLADFTGISVSYQLKEANGDNAVSAIEGVKDGKVAIAAATSLNGYDNGVKIGWIGEDSAAYVAGTKQITFDDVDAADLATVAGFNFQVSATAENQYYVITEIKLLAD